MRYAKIEKNSVSNGSGIRVVLWCQGCSLECPGCHNQSTWDFNEGSMFDVKAIQTICEELEKPYVAGITLSGGHPLEPNNIEVCTSLCRYLKRRFPEKTVWLYTGWLWENINQLDIMNYTDVLVEGPYIQSLRDISLPYCGSSNQRVIDVQKSLKENKLVIFS